VVFTTRRANGAGGVHRLPGNRRKPWQARITIGHDENGKQLYKNIGYYETKALAEQAISLDAVMPVSEKQNFTLKQLWEEWKETRAYTDLSRQAQGSYSAAYKYMKRFYNTKFRDLRLPQFQSMVDLADAMHRSLSTMKHIKTLSGILSKYAKDQDIILKTYYENVRLPKTEKKKINTFSELEIKTLFMHDDMKTLFKGVSLQIVDTILILIYTGMRISELLKLTKFDVDIKNMLITGGVKTEAGKDRIIPIHPKIQKYVQARYETAENYLIEYEKEIGNEKKGTKRTVKSRYNYEYYSDLYYETLKTLEIRRLTPHKARHTFATMVTSQCADRKAIALLIGHTDPNFTEKTYVQPDVERLRTAMESIDNVKPQSTRNIQKKTGGK
jgi:integrase